MSLRGNHLKNPAKQLGAAIIVALFVTALVAAIAIAMIARLQVDTRRTELLLNNFKATQLAEGSIDWAIDQLITNWKQQQAGRVIDRTPIHIVNDMDGATIESTLYDAQGKFNLNNLSDATFQEFFARLLHIIQPNLDQGTIQNIVLNTAYWITSNTTSTQLEDYYAKLKPPYHPPHRLMASISELRMVRGMTATLYTQLEPYITVLPEKTMININNAPIPILMSLGPDISLETAKTLDEFRRQTPFANLDALVNFPVVKNSPIAQNNLTVSSNYFLLETIVKIGDQRVTLYTMLMRLMKNSQPIVVILWQSKGTL